MELVSGSCFLFDAGCKGSLIYFLVNALPLVVAAGAALPFRSGTSHRLATVTGQPVLGSLLLPGRQEGRAQLSRVARLLGYTISSQTVIR